VGGFENLRLIYYKGSNLNINLKKNNMETIIAYDISDKHTEFKNEMKALGYQDKIPGVKNCKWIYLPNTTLYHPSKNPSTARDETQNICKNLKIKLERCFSTTWNRDYWGAICGEQF
jgi:hypothetical protein